MGASCLCWKVCLEEECCQPTRGRNALKRWDQQKEIWRVKVGNLILYVYIYFYIYIHMCVYIFKYIYIHTWFLKIWITKDCLLFLVWKVACESGISTFLCERMDDVLPNLISYVLNISCVLLLHEIWQVTSIYHCHWMKQKCSHFINGASFFFTCRLPTSSWYLVVRFRFDTQY